MFKYRTTMPASVLASVLVVSTLIFLGMLSVILLWDSELYLTCGYCNRQQQKAHLASAVALYCQDTVLNNLVRSDTSLVLFPELPASEVKLRKRPWGLYEMLEVAAGQEKTRCLLGKAAAGFHRAVLYVSDRRQPLSLAGNTRIEGKLYLGTQGVTYTRMRAEFFGGTPVPPSRIGRSGPDLPVVEEGITGYVETLFRQNPAELPEAELAGTASFGGQPVFCRVGCEISGMNLVGPYVLCAADSLFIRADNRLGGVLVVAGKVRIEKGFRGCLQIFARDSIVLEERVRLQGGSGLWVSGENNRRSLRLGDECSVDGYVVVMGSGELPEQPLAHYFQPAGSRIKGLVYVDGIAHIQGVVEGSIYAAGLCYFAPEGYYSDLLYDLSVVPGSRVVYPFLLKGPAERREVK